MSYDNIKDKKAQITEQKLSYELSHKNSESKADYLTLSNARVKRIQIISPDPIFHYQKPEFKKEHHGRLQTVQNFYEESVPIAKHYNQQFALQIQSYEKAAGKPLYGVAKSPFAYELDKHRENQLVLRTAHTGSFVNPALIISQTKFK